MYVRRGETPATPQQGEKATRFREYTHFSENLTGRCTGSGAGESLRRRKIKKNTNT